MRKKEKLAFGIALLAAATSCSVDEITIPAEELFHREFIKSYGRIAPDQDWSVIKRSSVTVTTPQSADVQVYARNAEGKTSLVASYREVNGTETIYFDVPKEVEYVYVQSGTQFHTVILGESVSLAPARSRAIDGKDTGLLDYVSSRDSVFGYKWEYEYVKAFSDIVGEGEACKNLDNGKITTDFNFVSSGEPFVFYPMYWNTGAHNVLGVYWYERGELKTRDIFQNRRVKGWDKVVNSSHPHNMFRKSTKGPSDIVIESTPVANSREVARTGNITLSFSTAVKWSGTAEAKLIPVPDVENLPDITLRQPTLSDNGKTATFEYADIAPNTLYTFSLPAGAFTSTNISTLSTKEYTFDFRTVVITPIPVAITPDYEQPIPMSGTITITYDKEITLGTAGVKATLTPIGNNEATAKIDEGTISGKTLTYTYTVSHAETEYKFSLPSGAVKSTAYDEPNLGTVYTFTTAKKTIDYAPTATLLGINLPTSTDNIYRSGDIVAEDANLLVSIVTTDASTVKAKTNKWEYSVPGFAEKQTLNTQIQSKSNGVPSADDINAGGPNGDGNAIFVIDVKKEMVLSVYGSSKKDKDVTKANIHLFNRETKTKIEPRARILSGTMSDCKQVNFVYIVTPGLYTLCYDKSGFGYVAGFSYQEVTKHYDSAAEQAVATRRITSRILSDNGRTTSENFDSTDRLIYPDTISAINDGFSRSTHNAQSSYVDNNGPDGGEDDIITHRISINLPKGTVFGFYIRNNHGANNITNREGNSVVVPYNNYSMSNLNRELENSFFNSLDETNTEEYNKYKDGWGKDKTSYLTKTERKFSTAATYLATNGYRYFSFEDWVDADLNDIVFMVAPESKIDIIDLEVDTDPYIFAVEDLGGTTSSDIDFNDAVFAVEHVAANNNSVNCLFVTMLAAGGTYPIQLMFDGVDVDGTSTGGDIIKSQSIVHGPHAGTGKKLGHINEWFNVPSQNTTINVAGDHYAGFGNLTTVRIDISDPNYTLAAKEGDKGKFSIRVARPDGTLTTIEKPSETGTAPQFLILPCSWHWPKEGKAIHEAYPGGINAGGGRFGSFQDWVNNGYDYTFKDDPKSQWHQNPSLHLIMDHAWQGSQAARELINELKGTSTGN